MQVTWECNHEIEDDEFVTNSILSLYGFLKDYGWEGYDPYDGLNSRFTSGISGGSKWLRVFFVQFNKSFPINLRSILRIKKGIHLKGMGLLASAFIKLFRTIGDSVFLKETAFCLDFLKKKSLKGHYTDHCWGDYFEYQATGDNLTADTTNTPDIINTVVCASAFLEHYRITGNTESLDIAASSRNFIINTLYINDGGKAFFKYTPESKHGVITYNASSHGAAFLARINAHIKEKTDLEIATNAMDYVASKQKPNGAWHYSDVNGREKIQIDFHQGFILDDLYDFIKYVRPADNRYMKTLMRGVKFYRNQQFLPDGRAKWRWPAIYPIDIHNQAQGIITFTKLSRIEPEHLVFAKKIADWTIKHMQNARGEFYYRKHRYFTNKIPYIRWSQAWMMLALSTLLESMRMSRES